ncbi:hypothetical protein NPIL_267381 [Nephila pilipes]|uniref:Uncharacterized protein n=1 Tax=Nephila pilipes TaxID=299642 RepID=A0A8X6MPW0_NEPPI|nr:hypothetical protein NPIL_267381 [Nephila pilipes]
MFAVDVLNCGKQFFNGDFSTFPTNFLYDEKEIGRRCIAEVTSDKAVEFCINFDLDPHPSSSCPLECISRWLIGRNASF